MFDVAIVIYDLLILSLCWTFHDLLII